MDVDSVIQMALAILERSGSRGNAETVRTLAEYVSFLDKEGNSEKAAAMAKLAQKMALGWGMMKTDPKEAGSSLESLGQPIEQGGPASA